MCGFVCKRFRRHRSVSPTNPQSTSIAYNVTLFAGAGKWCLCCFPIVVSRSHSVAVPLFKIPARQSLASLNPRLSIPATRWPLRSICVAFLDRHFAFLEIVAGRIQRERSLFPHNVSMLDSKTPLIDIKTSLLHFHWSLFHVSCQCLTSHSLCTASS
jgi:hypothetical protein